jgi:hypothetical protein
VAEHSSHASRHHTEAAEHYEAGNHENAAHNAHVAHGTLNTRGTAPAKQQNRTCKTMEQNNRGFVLNENRSLVGGQETDRREIFIIRTQISEYSGE